MKRIIDINLEDGKLSIIDFRSVTCGPCNALSKIIDTIETEDANFYECSMEDDESDDFIIKYKIRNAPTLVFVKNGIEVNRIIGMCTKDSILDAINKYK